MVTRSWFFTVKTSKITLLEHVEHAGMAKLVDALGLGPSGAICGGSSPLPGTIY